MKSVNPSSSPQSVPKRKSQESFESEKRARGKRTEVLTGRASASRKSAPPSSAALVPLDSHEHPLEAWGRRPRAVDGARLRHGRKGRTPPGAKVEPPRMGQRGAGSSSVPSRRRVLRRAGCWQREVEGNGKEESSRRRGGGRRRRRQGSGRCGPSRGRLGLLATVPCAGETANRKEGKCRRGFPPSPATRRRHAGHRPARSPPRADR
jgi:hypothetical protein